MASDLAALRITEATQDYTEACLREFATWVNDSPETINALSSVNSRDAMILGFAIALRALMREACKDAGVVVHDAWVRGMQRQHRDVPRERLKWRTLGNDDKALDSAIARDVVVWLVSTVGGKVPNINAG